MKRQYGMSPEQRQKRLDQGEVLCGGFIVLGRSSEMRLKVPVFPFEWSTKEAALAEADRLASLFPSKGFFVFELTDGVVHHGEGRSNDRVARVGS